MIEAMKEQQKQIESLRAEIESLKKQIKSNHEEL
jgi:capsule polysaccharide export protein KpsE/RkpR